MKNHTQPSEFERRLVEDARKVVGEINGSPVSNLDRVWLTLRTMTDKPDVAKLVLQHYGDALKADQAWREYVAAECLAYKTHWGPIFDMKRKTKQPLPKVYPDPDDIVIHADLSVRFLGPVTECDARDWEFFRKAREAFFVVAQEIVERAGHFCSIEEERAKWAKVRRHYYRVNRHLPANFKRKYPARFPPFTPFEVCPSEIVDDDDRGSHQIN